MSEHCSFASFISSRLTLSHLSPHTRSVHVRAVAFLSCGHFSILLLLPPSPPPSPPPFFSPALLLGMKLFFAFCFPSVLPPLQPTSSPPRRQVPPTAFPGECRAEVLPVRTSGHRRAGTRARGEFSQVGAARTERRRDDKQLPHGRKPAAARSRAHVDDPS